MLKSTAMLASVFAWFVWFALCLNCCFENGMMLPAVFDPWAARLQFSHSTDAGIDPMLRP